MPLPFLATLRRASFSGLAFPWLEYSLSSTLRKYEHEFRYTPGDSKEKHGRRSYSVRFAAVFDQAYNVEVLPGGGRGYPGLYPDGLNKLRELFDAVTVGDLIVPTLGTLPVVITSWEERVSTQLLTGHRVDITFEEDREKSQRLDKFIIERARSLATAVDVIQGEMAALKKDPSLDQRIFAEIDKLQDAVDTVLGIRDDILAVDMLIASRVEQVSAVFDELDKTMRLFQDPTRWQTLEAFKNLWASVTDLAADAGVDTGLQFRKYTTPRLMTILDVSQALYKTTSRTFDILQINDVPEPMAIQANTTLDYVADAA